MCLDDHLGPARCWKAVILYERNALAGHRSRTLGARYSPSANVGPRQTNVCELFRNLQPLCIRRCEIHQDELDLLYRSLHHERIDDLLRSLSLRPGNENDRQLNQRRRSSSDADRMPGGLELDEVADLVHALTLVRVPVNIVFRLSRSHALH